MAKKIIKDIKAREALGKGVDILANAVRVTLGPKGRNVLLEKKYGLPVVTNDGVTIAQEIEVEESEKNVGVQVAKEIATKTNDLVGDGTTTALVLAQENAPGRVEEYSFWSQSSFSVGEWKKR